MLDALPEYLRTPGPHGHFVQLYDSDSGLLVRNVALYIAEGLNGGEGAIVIATSDHREAFRLGLEKLGVDTSAAIANSRLLLLDARTTLGEFMIEGRPNEKLFEKAITAAMERVEAVAPSGLRAYGEMVGLLWTAGEYSAAVQLEELWNRLLRARSFSLFCSYPIDIFAKDFQISGVDALLCDHTHLVPSGSDEALESALSRAMDERLGARAQGLRLLIKANYRPSWALLPKAEGMILWLRNNLPNDADDILGLAREYYRGSSPALT